MVVAVERAVAEPPLSVEPATADSVREVEPAIADVSKEGGSIRVDEVKEVEPALTYEEIQESKNENHDGVATAAAATTKVDAAVDDFSVENLRTKLNVRFECYAAVLHGASPKTFIQRILPCIFDERDYVSYGEVKKYVLIVEGSCFIYKDHTDAHPLYAIDLTKTKPIVDDRIRPDPESATISPLPNENLQPVHMKTINLKYISNMKQAYQFTFDTKNDSTLAKRFMDAVECGSECNAITTATTITTTTGVDEKPIPSSKTK